CLVRRHDHGTLTPTGARVGTPGYMAPEIVRGDSGDSRSDVFALGCVAFESLTGRPPFTGKDLFSILTSVVLDQAPRLTDLGVEAPTEWNSLFDALLAKAPARRPRDGADLVARLADLDAAPLAAAARPDVGASVERMCAVVAASHVVGANSDTGMEGAPDTLGQVAA